MRLDTLEMTHFRNYTQLSLAFPHRMNVLVGQNGQGKTNLLEALYFLSHARSYRTSREKELMQLPASNPATGVEDDRSFTQIKAQLQREGVYQGPVRLEARLQRHPTTSQVATRFLRDGQPLKSRSQLVGQLACVSFATPDLLLFRGAPEDRRRWLDGALSQYDPLSLEQWIACHQVMKQKRELLRHPYPDDTVLEVLNEQLAQTAAAVVANRLRYLAGLYPAVLDTMQTLGSPLEQAFSWQYQLAGFSPPDGQYPIAAQSPPPGLEEALLQQLHRQLWHCMTEEKRLHQCLVGPHRDDFTLALDEGRLPVHRFASQGQQRSLVLALKWAEWQRLHDKLKEPPLLLLDDVMAELDPTRQAALVGLLQHGPQVFLTTTHVEPGLVERLDPTHPATVWQVDGGEVNPRD